MTLSRKQIRQVECPECGAPPKKRCKHTGVHAAKKNSEGRNHYERMQLAQKLLQPEKHESDTDPLIDDGDRW